MSGKTAYERIYVASAADVDISQSSVKITGFDRNPDQKYKVLGKINSLLPSQMNRHLIHVLLLN